MSGIFEVRIYPAEYSIHRIMAYSKDPQGVDSWHEKIVGGYDFNKVDGILSGVDRAAIKRRKNLYNRLYHEARISHEPGKGISFTNMLLLLAHHKLIVDREALVYVSAQVGAYVLLINPLSLKDLVVRTETNKLVTDLVDFDRVQSLLLMILYRRRYLAQREQARMQQYGLVQSGQYLRHRLRMHEYLPVCRHSCHRRRRLPCHPATDDSRHHIAWSNTCPSLRRCGDADNLTGHIAISGVVVLGGYAVVRGRHAVATDAAAAAENERRQHVVHRHEQQVRSYFDLCVERLC